MSKIISLRAALLSLFVLFCFSSSVSVRAMDSEKVGKIALKVGKIALIAGAAGVAWLAYRSFWTGDQQNKLNEKILVGNSPCTGSKRALSDNVFVVQIKVLNQFDINAGGCTSCGYQALKNSLETCLSLIQESDNLHHQLHNTELVQKLFGEQGVWRNEVIRMRMIQKYKRYLNDLLNPCLRSADQVTHQGFNTENVRTRYEFALNDFTNSLVDNIFKNQSVQILYDDFLCFFNNIPIHIDNVHVYYKQKEDSPSEDVTTGEIPSVEDLTECLRNPETIALYIDSSKFPSLTLNLNNWQSVIQKEEDGEWIDETEIMAIVNDPQTIGFQLYTVIGNMNLVTPETSWSQEWNKVQHVRKELNDHIVNNYFHCFLIGTMSQMVKQHEAVESTSMGHWFVVVVHKNEKNRTYYIADSTNCNRLNDERVNKLIEALGR